MNSKAMIGVKNPSIIHVAFEGLTIINTILVAMTAMPRNPILRKGLFMVLPEEW